MDTYTPKSFDIPLLNGISQAQIDAHLKLYEGYVKHVNVVSQQVKKWVAEDREANSYPVQELWRRLAFEFNGMRSHEYYFGALTGGTQQFDPESDIGKAILKQFGSFASWKEILTQVGTTRGSGWAMMYYDPHATEKNLIVGWIDEHHIGYLSSLPLVLALDCWEHAYMVDHPPSGRAAYIDAYINNLNWETINTWFQNAHTNAVQ